MTNDAATWKVKRRRMKFDLEERTTFENCDYIGIQDRVTLPLISNSSACKALVPTMTDDARRIHQR